MCLASPARVISVSGQTAVVDYDGVRTSARLETLSEPVAPGDYLLVHAGFAIQRLSAEDGEETLRLFDELAQSLNDEAARDPQDGHSTPSSPPQPASRVRSPKAEGKHTAPSPQPHPVTGDGSPEGRGGHGP